MISYFIVALVNEGGVSVFARLKMHIIYTYVILPLFTVYNRGRFLSFPGKGISHIVRVEPYHVLWRQAHL